MATKAQSRPKSKKTTGPRGTKHDRRLLEQAAGEDSEAGAPSSTLRSIKAAAPVEANSDQVADAIRLVARVAQEREEASKAEREEFEREYARKQAVADTKVPITLGQLCRLIAHDVTPDRFAATALTELAAQMEILADAAEDNEFNDYEAWKFTQNLIERMRLAGRVTAWLADGATSEALPKVAP